jgi:hypothetical protein
VAFDASAPINNSKKGKKRKKKKTFREFEQHGLFTTFDFG